MGTSPLPLLILSAVPWSLILASCVLALVLVSPLHPPLCSPSPTPLNEVEVEEEEEEVSLTRRIGMVLLALVILVDGGLIWTAFSAVSSNSPSIFILRFVLFVPFILLLLLLVLLVERGISSSTPIIFLCLSCVSCVFQNDHYCTAPMATFFRPNIWPIFPCVAVPGLHYPTSNKDRIVEIHWT